MDLNKEGIKFPVDILADVSQGTLECIGDDFMNILLRNPSSLQHLTLADTTQVPISLTNVGFVPLYGDGDEQKVLALFSPSDQFTAVALYLLDRWWTIDDILKTADPERDGAMKAETVAERIVLYILNRVVYRNKEMSTEELPFLCHRKNDYAKILWKNGEAIGFYSVKSSGQLCRSYLTQRYQLPVMDSIFVKKQHRGVGFGLELLEDFVFTFNEDCLGLMCPLSKAMYRVCEKYLRQHPGHRNLLWEVHSMGGLKQRTNIAKRIWAIDLKAISKNLSFVEKAVTRDVTKDDTEPGELIVSTQHRDRDLEGSTMDQNALQDKLQNVVRIEDIEAETPQEVQLTEEDSNDEQIADLDRTMQAEGTDDMVIEDKAEEVNTLSDKPTILAIVSAQQVLGEATVATLVRISEGSQRMNVKMQQLKKISHQSHIEVENVASEIEEVQKVFQKENITVVDGTEDDKEAYNISDLKKIPRETVSQEEEIEHGMKLQRHRVAEAANKAAIEETTMTTPEKWESGETAIGVNYVIKVGQEATENTLTEHPVEVVVLTGKSNEETRVRPLPETAALEHQRKNILSQISNLQEAAIVLVNPRSAHHGLQMEEKEGTIGVIEGDTKELSTVKEQQMQQTAEHEKEKFKPEILAVEMMNSSAEIGNAQSSEMGVDSVDNTKDTIEAEESKPKYVEEKALGTQNLTLKHKAISETFADREVEISTDKTFSADDKNSLVAEAPVTETQFLRGEKKSVRATPRPKSQRRGKRQPVEKTKEALGAVEICADEEEAEADNCSNNKAQGEEAITATETEVEEIEEAAKDATGNKKEIKKVAGGKSVTQTEEIEQVKIEVDIEKVSEKYKVGVLKEGGIKIRPVDESPLLPVEECELELSQQEASNSLSAVSTIEEPMLKPNESTQVSSYGSDAVSGPQSEDTTFQIHKLQRATIVLMDLKNTCHQLQMEERGEKISVKDGLPIEMSAVKEKESLGELTDDSHNEVKEQCVAVIFERTSPVEMGDIKNSEIEDVADDKEQYHTVEQMEEAEPAIVKDKPEGGIGEGNMTEVTVQHAAGVKEAAVSEAFTDGALENLAGELAEEKSDEDKNLDEKKAPVAKTQSQRSGKKTVKATPRRNSTRGRKQAQENEEWEVISDVETIIGKGEAPVHTGSLRMPRKTVSDSHQTKPMQVCKQFWEEEDTSEEESPTAEEIKVEELLESVKKEKVMEEEKFEEESTNNNAESIEQEIEKTGQSKDENITLAAEVENKLQETLTEDDIIKMTHLENESSELLIEDSHDEIKEPWGAVVERTSSAEMGDNKNSEMEDVAAYKKQAHTVEEVEVTETSIVKEKPKGEIGEGDMAEGTVQNAAVGKDAALSDAFTDGELETQAGELTEENSDEDKNVVKEKEAAFDETRSWRREKNTVKATPRRKSTRGRKQEQENEEPEVISDVETSIDEEEAPVHTRSLRMARETVSDTPKTKPKEVHKQFQEKKDKCEKQCTTAEVMEVEELLEALGKEKEVGEEQVEEEATANNAEGIEQETEKSGHLEDETVKVTAELENKLRETLTKATIENIDLQKESAVVLTEDSHDEIKEECFAVVEGTSSAETGDNKNSEMEDVTAYKKQDHTAEEVEVAETTVVIDKHEGEIGEGDMIEVTVQDAAGEKEAVVSETFTDGELETRAGELTEERSDEDKNWDVDVDKEKEAPVAKTRSWRSGKKTVKATPRGKSTRESKQDDKNEEQEVVSTVQTNGDKEEAAVHTRYLRKTRSVSVTPNTKAKRVCKQFQGEMDKTKEERTTAEGIEIEEGLQASDKEDEEATTKEAENKKPEMEIGETKDKMETTVTDKTALVYNYLERATMEEKISSIQGEETKFLDKVETPVLNSPECNSERLDRDINWGESGVVLLNVGLMDTEKNITSQKEAGAVSEKEINNVENDNSISSIFVLRAREERPSVEENASKDIKEKEMNSVLPRCTTNILERSKQRYPKENREEEVKPATRQSKRQKYKVQYISDDDVIERTTDFRQEKVDFQSAGTKRKREDQAGEGSTKVESEQMHEQGEESINMTLDVVDDDDDDYEEVETTEITQNESKRELNTLRQDEEVELLVLRGRSIPIVKATPQPKFAGHSSGRAKAKHRIM